MIDWVLNNRTWLFSGAGISALLLVLWLAKKLFPQDEKGGSANTINHSPTMNQFPTVNQSPVITINNSTGPPPVPSRRDPDSGVQSEIAPLSEEGGRPRIFSLPPGIEDLSVETFGGAAAHFNRDHISTFLARFKLVADDRGGIGHEISASIEYVDRFRVPHRRFVVENIVLRVGRGYWKGAGGTVQIIEEGGTLELVVGFIVDARPYALLELRGDRPPSGPSFQAVPVVSNSEPIVRVTLVDIHYGWRWRIDYSMRLFPVDLREESRLIALKR
jgi:hypothetical protein